MISRVVVTGRRLRSAFGATLVLAIAGAAGGGAVSTVGGETIRYAGFYNGQSGLGDYRIGRAVSPDGLTWRRSGVVLEHGTGWDRVHVKDPWAVVVKGVVYLYYAGYDGPPGDHYRIGLAISRDGARTFKRAQGGPVVGIGRRGSFDERRVAFPAVLYEPQDPVRARRWKLWYDGRDAAGVERIGYATSGDGVRWVKHGVVLRPGPPGSWDDRWDELGSVARVGGRYYVFFGG